MTKNKKREVISKELQLEFDREKNSVSASSVFKHSSTKYWWLCSLNHSFEASAHNRSAGTECPYCKNRKILVGFNDLATTHPNLISEWADERCSPTTVFAGSSKNYLWKCSLGHLWEDSPLHRREKNRGCPYCSGHRILAGFNDLTTTHPNLALEWASQDLSPKNYSKTSGKIVEWKCRNGHLWKAPIVKRVLRGLSCPQCSTVYRVRNSDEDWTKSEEKTIARKLHVKETKMNRRREFLKINSVGAVYPMLVSSFMSPKESFTVTKGSHKIVRLKCSDLHEWEEPVYSFVKRKSCLVCLLPVLEPEVNSLLACFPKIAVELEDESIADKVHWRSKRIVKWCCENSHVRVESVVDRIKYGCCRDCFPVFRSNLERVVFSCLRSFYGGEIIVNSRPIRGLNGFWLEIDILLPELKLGFEVQDFNSHAKIDGEFSERYKRFKNGPREHELKKKLALEQLGVNIVELWEDEVLSDTLESVLRELVF